MEAADATVYVGNVPWRATEDDLAEVFERFGPVVSIRIIQDPETGRSRGYGFVEFASAEIARRVVTDMNGIEMDGRVLTVAPARPKRS